MKSPEASRHGAVASAGKPVAGWDEGRIYQRHVAGSTSTPKGWFIFMATATVP